MIVGCLGDIVFQVSDKTIETIDNFKWSGSARYSTHQRHGTNALTEFTGVDPDKISFDITLSAYLGVNPQMELYKIWNAERSGAALPLVLGDKAYGKYRWNILSHSTVGKYFDSAGVLTHIVVSVSLQEYLRG